MTQILAILAVVAVGIWLLFRAVRGRQVMLTDAAQLPLITTPLDLVAFRNLVDPDREAFLRTMVDQSEFVRLRRDWAKAVLAYIRALAFNASVLHRLGELAADSPDLQIAQAGALLAREALTTRILCLRAGVRLLTIWLMPHASISLSRLL